MPASLFRHWSPAAILAAGLLLAAAAGAITLTLALRQPWMGLRLAATVDGKGLIIESARGPAAGLATGTPITALAAGTRPRLPLDIGDLAPEPDTRYPQLADYRDFLDKQNALARQLRHDGQVTLYVDGGAEHRLALAPNRPWHDLPFGFWLQLGVAISGFLAGVSVWTYRRRDPAARYLAMMGVGLLASAAAAAVYSTRELALSGTLFRVLQALNGLGSMLFCAAFVATLWHYPTRISPRDPGPLLIVSYLALSTATALQWLPSFDVGLRLPILAGFVATIVLGVMQWRRTRQRPVERAALQWFLLAWFSGSTAFLGLIFVPVLFGIDTGAMQGYAFGLFLLIYLGLAFGIVRYRLFELDRWWLNAWSFLLLLGLLLSISLALFLLLGADPLITASLALASTGWLYLPLRQWLAGRFKRAEASLPQVLQHVIDAGATAPGDLWRESLSRLFRPLHIQELTGTRSAAEIGDDGMALSVPGLQSCGELRLLGCDGGTRLFGERDQLTADAMRTLIQRLVDYARAVQLGAERERLRVSRDLHDDLGARLLDLLHRSEGDAQERVRGVLDELRLVTTSLGSRGETFEDLLGICRAEAAERLEGASVTLYWQQPEPMPELPLGPHQTLMIVRTLREALALALLHGEGVLEVAASVDDGACGIDLHHRCRAPVTLPSSVQPHPLTTLRARAEALGGSLELGARNHDGWHLRLRLPLQIPEPASTI